MGNYIKTLILSTMVLVIGNNSNYCYSMEYYNNEHIIENEHLLRNGSYFEYQFNNSKNIFETKLDNLVKNGVYNQGDVSSLLNTLNNFFQIYSNLCNTLIKINEKFITQEFNKNILNKEMPGFMPDNILIQYNEINFEQLLNYFINRIYHLMINSIRKISNTTDNNLNINDLKNSIMKEIAQCYSNIEENMSVFLGFCNNNINDKKSINRLRDSFLYYINKLVLFNKDNNLNSYKYFEELDPNHTGTIKVSENFLNKNYSDEMCNMMSDFEKNISNIYNIGNIINIQDPENKNRYINIIDEFNKHCNNISANMCFLTKMQNDYPNMEQNLLLSIDVKDLDYIPSLRNYCNNNNIKTITLQQLLNYYANYIMRLQRNAMKNIQHYITISVQNLDYNIKSEISKCIKTIEITMNQLFNFLKNNKSIIKKFKDIELDVNGFDRLIKCSIEYLNELNKAINEQNNQ